MRQTNAALVDKTAQNRVWTDAYASDAVFTPEQGRIYIAWMSNEDRFEEFDKDFGFKTVNEERLKAFLAERFNTTTDEIYDTVLHIINSTHDQEEEMTVPSWLELGRLDNQ